MPRPQLGLDHPDAVQFVAHQAGIDRPAADDVPVALILLADAVAIVGNVKLPLADQGPLETIRGAVIGVDLVGGCLLYTSRCV